MQPLCTSCQNKGKACRKCLKYYYTKAKINNSIAFQKHPVSSSKNIVRLIVGVGCSLEEGGAAGAHACYIIRRIRVAPMNGAIAPGSHAEKSPHKGEHDNARTHTHKHFHKPIHTFGFKTHHTLRGKKKAQIKTYLNRNRKNSWNSSKHTFKAAHHPCTNHVKKTEKQEQRTGTETYFK